MINYIITKNWNDLEKFEIKADLMKDRVLSSTDPLPESFPGKCYYFSSEGCDNNDGLSPEKSLKSLEMVEQLPLEPGDAVLFRRGDLFRGSVNCNKNGITFSAWGSGDKPVICGSKRNYADPSLWVKSSVPGIWECTVPLKNVGVVSFDHDPRTIGKYDVLLGYSIPREPEMEPIPYHLKKDLDFCNDLDTDLLYLKSEENPGIRFSRIEIGEMIHLFCFRGEFREDLTVDNLHITMTGGHGISFVMHKGGEVKNCVFDYVGGSVLWRNGGSIMSPLKNIRFGNAIESYGTCRDFKVRNNWIYQIYDTGITHQFHHNHDVVCTQERLEYSDNLIEYCFWAIEYYNYDGKYCITRDISVHDNFCRFGGTGWGCTPLRWRMSPMYCFLSHSDELENYRTERNIFQFTRGYIYKHFPPVAPDGGLIFKDNIYIQYSGENFASWGDLTVPFVRKDAEHFLERILKETGYILFEAD